MVRFSLSTWLKHLVQTERPRKTRRGRRLWLQVLEERAVPATVSWINPDGGDWSVAANWSTGALPGPNDDVVIGDLVTGATVRHSTGSDSVHSLHIHANTFQLSGGTLSLAAASDTDSEFDLTSPFFAGGLLLINGSFVTSGNSTWSAGSVGGTGQWFNEGTLSVTPGGAHNLLTTLTNDNTVAQTGQMMLDGNGVIDNTPAALYDIQADVSIQLVPSGPATTRFDNYGTLRKSGGGTFDSLVQTANNLGGTIDVEVGNLSFDSTGRSLAGGTFIVVPGSTLSIGGLNQGTGNVAVSGLFTGAGGGRVNLVGNLNVTALGATVNFTDTQLVWGNATINGGQTGLTNLGTLSSLNISHSLSGLLINYGTIQQAQNSWLTMNAGAVLVNEPGAVYDVQGDGNIFGPSGQPGSALFYNAGTLVKSGGTGTSLFTPALNNAGTVEADAGGLLVQTSVAQLIGGLLIGGTWNVTGGATLTLPGSPITTNVAAVTVTDPGSRLANLSGLSSNAGTLSLLNGSTLTTPANFYNSGTVMLGAGAVLTVGGSGNYTQTSGYTGLNGGILATATPGNNVYIRGGVLDGFGTVQANLVNDGEVTVEPGGNGLVVSGVFIQSDGGVLDVTIGGYNPGTDFSVLQVGGFASLAGTLNVNLANGFNPAPFDSFTILTSAQIGGTFTSYNGLVLGVGKGFSPVYDATSLTLVVVQV